MCHGVDVEVRERLLTMVSSLPCHPGKEFRPSGLAAMVPLPIEPSGQPQFSCSLITNVFINNYPEDIININV